MIFVFLKTFPSVPLPRDMSEWESVYQPVDPHWLYSTSTTAKYHPCSCMTFVFKNLFFSPIAQRHEWVWKWVSECLSTSWPTSIGWTVQAQQLNIIHACACIICHFLWVRVLKSSLMLLVLLCRTVLMAEWSYLCWLPLRLMQFRCCQWLCLPPADPSWSEVRFLWMLVGPLTAVACAGEWNLSVVELPAWSECSTEKTNRYGSCDLKWILKYILLCRHLHNSYL